MPKNFQRKIEDFVCENCGVSVTGNGYTNHCPKCLYSKHVDNNPGDRENECGGLMKPTEVLMKEGEYHIIHVCQKCQNKNIQTRKINKVSPEDDFDTLVKISKKSSE